jgi:hypothetical protein
LMWMKEKFLKIPGIWSTCNLIFSTLKKFRHWNFKVLEKFIFTSNIPNKHKPN